MDVKTALLIFLYQGMILITVQAERSALFTTQDNKRLEGHVVKQFTSLSLMSCSHFCLRNAWCTSTNFKEPSEKNGKGSCELNKHGAIDENTKPRDEQGVTFSVVQEKVIYHQTMTPSWLRAHASYIDIHHTWSTEQITFNAGPKHQAALLKVPMIPAGVLKHSASLTAKIVGSHDVDIGKKEDSDISYGVSDGISFVGFNLEDTLSYHTYAPCFGREGSSGVSLTGEKDLSPKMPKPSDSFYPGQFTITLKLDESWGSCYIAHDGGFVKTAVYSKHLVFDKGLTLEVYKGQKHERVGIKLIEVTVIQDA